MDLSAPVLGKTVVSYIATRQRSVVLQIGRDRFDRAALSAVACFNFLAADRLSHILNRELQVTDTRDLFDRVNPNRLALPGLGGVSLAVLGAAFQAKGIGGGSPLLNWFRKHELNPVTFSTIKHRDAAERAKEKTETKTRRRARKTKAHELRVNRFEQRKVGT